MSKEKPKKLTLYVCRKIVRAMEQSDNIHNLIRLCPNQEVKSFLVKTRDELMTQAHDLMSKYQTS